jgi:hypothetical protein
MAVVQEPVEDRGGDHLVAEDLAPLRDHLVGREQHAAALVATRDELEEQIRAALLEGQIAQLIDDEELRLREEADLLGEATFGFGLRKRADERRRRDEEDGVSGLDDGAAEADREVSLADTRRAEQQDILGAGDEVPVASSRTSR